MWPGAAVAADRHPRWTVAVSRAQNRPARTSSSWRGLGRQPPINNEGELVTTSLLVGVPAARNGSLLTLQATRPGQRISVDDRCGCRRGVERVRHPVRTLFLPSPPHLPASPAPSLPPSVIAAGHLN